MKNKFIKLFSKKSKRITKSYTYDEIKELFYKFVSKSTDEKNHNQTMGLNYQEEKYKYLDLLKLMRKDAINEILSTTLDDGIPLSKYNEQINTCEDFLRNPKYQIDNYIGRFSYKLDDEGQLIIKERKNGKHDIEYMDAFLRKLVRTTKYRVREVTEEMLNLIEKEFTDSNSFGFINKSQTDKVFDEFIDNPLLKFLIDMRFNLLNDKTSENSKLRFDIRIPKDKNPTHFI